MENQNIKTSVDTTPKKIGVFIIAYNAESQIEKTLSRIPEDIYNVISMIFVIDDCSTDKTVDKALSYKANRSKIKIIRNRVNQRYGGNQKLGYQYAIEQGLDVVVMLHADGQYAPEYLSKLLEPILSNKADVVFGTRMKHHSDALKGGMPKYKFLGNIVLTWFENALADLNLSEFHSGYRAYSVSFLKSIPFWENSDEWHFDTQILFQAKQGNARIEEIPIPTYYGDEICHVNGMIYGLNCIKSAILFMLHRQGIMYDRKYDVTTRGRRYFEKFNDPYSSHSMIWRYLEKKDLNGLRVLELGVGDSSITRRLHMAGAEIDGVELDENAAELAHPFCRKVYRHNLDDIFDIDLRDEYDMVIAADVLEHLRSPEIVLSHLKAHLKENGVLIVSLPNIANIYVRLNLLLGRWPTYSKGILDETHLHQYTLKTMQKLLRKTGWVIENKAVTSIPWVIVFPFLSKKPFSILNHMWYSLTRLFKGLLCYQGIFFCRNPNTGSLL